MCGQVGVSSQAHGVLDFTIQSGLPGVIARMFYIKPLFQGLRKATACYGKDMPKIDVP